MKKIVFAVCAVLLLSSCGWTKQKLGLSKTAPEVGNAKDELVVPPNYNLLPEIPADNGNL